MTASVIKLETCQVGIPVENYQVKFGYRELERPNLYQQTMMGLKVSLPQELHHYSLATVCRELSLVPELALHALQELYRLGMFNGKAQQDLEEVLIGDLDLTETGLEFHQRRALPSKLKLAELSLVYDPIKDEITEAKPATAPFVLERLVIKREWGKFSELVKQAIDTWIEGDYQANSQNHPKVYDKSATTWMLESKGWRDVDLELHLSYPNQRCKITAHSSDQAFNAYLQQTNIESTILTPLFAWIEKTALGYQKQKLQLEATSVFSKKTAFVSLASTPLLKTLDIPQVSESIRCYDLSKAIDTGAYTTPCIIFAPAQKVPTLVAEERILYLPVSCLPQGVISLFYNPRTLEKYAEKLGWIRLDGTTQLPLRLLQKTKFKPEFKPEYFFSVEPGRNFQQDFAQRFVDSGGEIDESLLNVWAFVCGYVTDSIFETCLPMLSIDQAYLLHTKIKATWDSDFKPEWLVDKILPLSSEAQVAVYDSYLGQERPLSFNLLTPKLQGQYLTKAISTYNETVHRFSELEPIHFLSLQLQVFNTDFKAAAVTTDKLTMLEQWLELSQQLQATYASNEALAKREKVYRDNLAKIRQLFVGGAVGKFAVFDTNFLIDQVEQLKTRLEAMANDSGYRLVIPAVVIEELKKLETDKKGRADKLTAQIEQLAPGVFKQEAQLEQAQLQAHKLEDEIAAVQAQLAEPSLHLTQLQDQIKELQQQRTLLNHDLANAERDLKNAQKNHQANEQQQAEQQARQQVEQKAEQEATQATLQSRQANEIELLKALYEKVLGMREAVTSQLAKLEAELEQTRSSLKDPQKHLKDLQKQLSESKKFILRLTTELSNVKKKEQELQAQLESLNNQSFNLRETQRILQQGDFSLLIEPADAQILKMLPLQNTETADAKILAVAARYKLCQVELYTSDKELANYAKSLNIVVRNSFA